MVRCRRLLPALLIVLLLCGCKETRILERTGFIQSIGFDLLRNGKLRVGVGLPSSDPAIKAEREYLETTEGKTHKDSFIYLARQTNLLLVSGQIRTILFGADLAKKGVWNYMESFKRDPVMSEKAKIIVVEGEATNILRKDYKSHPRTEKYIDRLVEKMIKVHGVPEVDMYTFARDYYDDGIDPVAAQIKDNGSSIKISGIALFRDDKYVTYVKVDDSIIFGYLYGPVVRAEMNIDLSKQSNKSQSVMISSMSSSRKIRITHDADGSITAHIFVKAKASVSEYIGELQIYEKSGRSKLEQEISTVLQQRADRLVTFLQDNNVDNLGIGSYVRNSMSHKAWKELDWRKVYPKIKVQTHFKMTINDYGFRRNIIKENKQ